MSGGSTNQRAVRRVPADAVPARRGGLAYQLAAATVVGWALFQNVYRLGTSPILPDEPLYQKAAWRAVNGLTKPALTASDGTGAAANEDIFERPALGKLVFGVPQWLLGHQSILADRVVAVCATLALAAVLAWWVTRFAGRWTGLLAGALAALLPARADPDALRMGRYAYMDPVASFFMVLSVVAAWNWSRRVGRSAWAWAVATGVATGCAAGMKENGALGVIGPVVLILVWAASDRDLRWSRVGQAVCAVVAAAVAFVVPYLWFSQPATRMAYLFAYQSDHNDRGHLVGYAGRVTEHADWWANGWFAARGMGPLVAVTIVALAGCAVVLRRDGTVWWCLAALSVPVLFHTLVSRVTLSFYWTAWTPALFVLAALGVDAIVRRVRAAGAAPWAIGAVTLALLAAPLAGAGAESRRVARLEPEGVMVLDRLRAEHGLDGAVLSVGVSLHLYAHYLPDTTVVFGITPTLAKVDTVVVGATRCRNVWDLATGRAVVAAARHEHRLRLVHADRMVRVYEVVRPLRPPTPAELAAQGPPELTRGC
ncbi:MAG: glycosyl transferase family 39 [Acidimicrobiales bacterium]|nr:glycosyl transferase family 39 [Acidimicrobiales bacterium]